VRTRARRLSASLLLLLLAGCGTEASADTPPRQAPAAPEIPAAAAGGVCQLLDYVQIERIVGVRFDIAAAQKVDKTYSCAVQSMGAPRPDLVLSVTVTQADAEVFQEELIPEGGAAVKGLGKAAYRQIRGAGGSAGPGVEVGWLTADARLIILRYTFPSGEPKSAADALAPKLVELAKEINQTSV
jgi:hypothetical protein